MCSIEFLTAFPPKKYDDNDAGGSSVGDGGGGGEWGVLSPPLLVRLVIVLLSPPRRTLRDHVGLSVVLSFCLSVCMQPSAKCYAWIYMKFFTKGKHPISN